MAVDNTTYTYTDSHARNSTYTMVDRFPGLLGPNKRPALEWDIMNYRLFCINRLESVYPNLEFVLTPNTTDAYVSSASVAYIEHYSARYDMPDLNSTDIEISFVPL